ncbi:MAG TPA: molybdenum cofactor guanylyltransferase [Chloroflexota bacterium]|nr:molybdenum cofactor guanylyltransferase [Chloroflexota bacterium]
MITPGPQPTGVLLAGGKSSRMGTNKALLRFPNGQTVIERIVSRIRPLCSEVLLVTNTPADYEFLGLPMFPDEIPGASSLGGIYTGVLHASSPRVVVLSCDLPLVSSDLLAYLLALPFDYDLLMPFIGGRQQPLHAIYARTALDAMRAQIGAGDLKIVRLLETLRGRVVTEAELPPEWLASFQNMNTPEDWEAVLALEDAQR